MGAIVRRGVLVAAALAGCTVGNVREPPSAPPRYDTRRVGREYTMTTTIEPSLYVDSLRRRAPEGGCTAAVSDGTLFIECGEAVHLRLAPNEKTVKVGCFAISIAACRKEIARLEALPDPKGAP